jgi:hypothetical protein
MHKCRGLTQCADTYYVTCLASSGWTSPVHVLVHVQGKKSRKTRFEKIGLHGPAGTSNIMVWEAADQIWTDPNEIWGIIKRGYNGASNIKKAGYGAFQAIFPQVPSGASILKNSALDPDLAVAVFIQSKTLVIVIVNDLDYPKTATVSVANVQLSGSNPVVFNTWTSAGEDQSIKGSLVLTNTNGLALSVQTFVDSVVVLKFGLI